MTKRLMRRGAWTLATLAGLILVGARVRCLYSAPVYTGAKSDHFDGTRFQNLLRTRHGGFRDLIAWMRERDRGAWAGWVAEKPGSRPPERVAGEGLRVTFVNHSTLLIQTGGVNILTDPIWSERCSPVTWAGPKRQRPPGIRFEDLPPIDVVVISHNHYDHMDVPTLRRLADKHNPLMISGLGNGAMLRSVGIERSVDLDWWDEKEIAPDLKITAVPAQHFSSRGICDRDRNLWAGYVVTTGHGSAYFAGDTGFGPHFAAIAERFGPMRLALLPIGAFRPEWFMQAVHISPGSAIEAARILRAGVSVPMHYGTFHLGDDGQYEPVEVLRKRLGQQSNPPLFRILEHGEGFDVP